MGLKQRVNHGVGKAVCDWAMIEDHDRILIGVSGGKDSLTLLHVLYSLKPKAPVSFELIPVHVDPGFENGLSCRLKQYVDENYGLLRVEKTDFGVRAHSPENSENPCFMCSRLRRKRLFELAREFKCKKIALGHHKDDLIETLFINMCYAGKMATMKPRQSFFDGNLDIIRPLSYVEGHEITKLSAMLNLPIFDNPCPSAGLTKRAEIREMLDGLYKQNRNIKGNLFRAMGNIARDYLLEMPS